MHPTCPLPTLAGLALLQLLFIPAAEAQTVEAGPHRVGFRVLEVIDYSRSIGPKRNYKGAPQPGNGGMPLPVSVWYPARPETGEAMPYGSYLALAQTHKRGTFGPITDSDRDAAARAENPDVDLVSTRTLDLMVFRARHRGAEDDVDRLNRLKREVLRK